LMAKPRKNLQGRYFIPTMLTATRVEDTEEIIRLIKQDKQVLRKRK